MTRPTLGRPTASAPVASASMPFGPDLAVQKIAGLRDELESQFSEREEVVRSLLVALVAGEHVLLLGPPGTAKSALANAVCKAIGGRFFGLLLTKFTVPEELFGPISLQGLERDEYRRVVDGYLPTADLAIIDECFKASSAILNSLLMIANEREFDNGGTRVKVPLQLLVGASNELPADDSLAALWDRFLLRHWVSPIASRDAMRLLLARTDEPAATARLDAADLAALRAARDLVVIPDDVLEVVLKIRDELAQKGVTASDRRWRKCMRAVRASAALEGRTVATNEDLLVLQHALWEDRDSIPLVASVIVATATPDIHRVNAVVDAAVEAYSAAPKAETRDRTKIEAMGRANETLAGCLDKLAAMDSTPASVRGVAKVEAMRRELAQLVARSLGIKF